MTSTIRLGSRGSPLALAQSELVARLLAQKTGGDAANFPIEAFTTSGDKIQDRRLIEAGGKGLFTKELDEALMANRIDAAVHSMKDLPTKLPDGIVLVCVPAREDARDAFVSNKAADLMALPKGAVIGTASLRRQAQTLHLRPDVKIVTLRGSVQTRLKKLEDGGIDATYLAFAGLKRLGLEDKATSLIGVDLIPPAPGQGALAITCRADDTPTRDALLRLSIPEFEIATVAERAFLAALDGSCRTPIAAFAKVDGQKLSFIGEFLSLDGAKCWRKAANIVLGANARADAEALGRKLGAEIRAEAGLDFQPEKMNGW
jgi:hydroxymethylbilane synthase